MASCGDESESDVEEERTGLLKYFRVKSNGVHCVIVDCKTTFKAWKSSNLKRHLENKHASVFAKLYPTEIDNVKQIKIAALELKLGAIELVTVNGQPFSLLNASSIRGFYRDKLNFLHKHRVHVRLDRKTIAYDVDEMSKEIVDFIKKEVRGRNICLMLDGCTKGVLSVLSICARYMIDDEIISRCLGVFELIHRHTAKYMAETVRDHIGKEFDISMSQVKAVVTDDAKNMILTRKLLNKLALGDSIEAYENVYESESDDDEDENEEENILAVDEFEIANILNDEDYAELISKTAQEFVNYYGSVLAVNPVTCSTHNLQLAIKDSLIDSAVTNEIEKVNDFCKLFRKKSVQIALKEFDVKIIKPHLKNVTRWNSDYVMLTDFLKLKKDWEHIQKTDDAFLVVDELFWSKIEELVETLQYPYLATKAMEKRDFCYTDLKLWSMRMKFKLDQIIQKSPHFNFARSLKEKLMIREKKIFETPVMMAALYLDPRFKSRLTVNETATAVETIHNLYAQIKSKPNITPNPELNLTIDRQIEAELFQNQENNDAHLRAEMTIAMSNYNSAQITNINRNAIMFWKENKQNYPQLYEVSNIILAIASSISEPERTFSAFSYIYNVRRMKLLPKNVTNILTIRCNKDIFYKLRDEKLDSIKNQ